MFDQPDLVSLIFISGTKFNDTKDNRHILHMESKSREKVGTDI